MSDYFDANGDLVWESDELDDRIYRAMVEVGYVLPKTAQEVEWVEDAMKDAPPTGLPERLRDPYELMRRHPEVFGEGKARRVADENE